MAGERQRRARKHHQQQQGSRIQMHPERTLRRRRGHRALHALLQIVFTPATWVFQLPGFSLQDVRALQGAASASAAKGALWVHLYAATLVLLVMIPRTALAFASHWRQNQLQHNFPLDLGLPYFRKLTARIEIGRAHV